MESDRHKSERGSMELDHRALALFIVCFSLLLLLTPTSSSRTKLWWSSFVTTVTG